MSTEGLGVAGCDALAVAMKAIQGTPELEHVAVSYARALDRAERYWQAWVDADCPLIENGYNGAPYPNPLVKAMRDEEAHAGRLAGKLGLRPSARKTGPTPVAKLQSVGSRPSAQLRKGTG